MIIINGAITYTISDTKKDSIPQEKVKTNNDNANFIVKHNCETYTKPNINSKISGYLETGKELYIENVNKFNYFYELNDENGRKSYILKEELEKIE